MEKINEGQFWSRVPWDDVECRHWQPIVFRQLVAELADKYPTDWALSPEKEQEVA